MAAKKPPTPSNGPRRAPRPDAVPDSRISVTVTVEGEHYVLYLDEVTSALEIQVHRSTTMPIEEILGSPEWPRYQVAAIVFLVRRLRGERCSYEEVADSLPFIGNEFDLGDLTLLDGETAPKAPDGEPSTSSQS